MGSWDAVLPTPLPRQAQLVAKPDQPARARRRSVATGPTAQSNLTALTRPSSGLRAAMANFTCRGRRSVAGDLATALDGHGPLGSGTAADSRSRDGPATVADPAAQAQRRRQQMQQNGERTGDSLPIALGTRQSQRAGRKPACTRRRSTRLWLAARRDYCFSSASTACGSWLACAMAAMEACCNTCALVRLAASAATLASRICDWAEEKLVICDCARLMA
jgi:hypothetical protein